MIASDLAERDPGNANVATWQADAATWTSQAADLKQRVNATLFDAARGVYKLADRDNGTHAGASVPQDGNAEAINYGLAPASAHGGHPELPQEQPLGHVRPAAVLARRELLDGRSARS